MWKKENHTDVETVYAESDLKHQIRRECGTIYVEGEIAKKIKKKFDSDPKWRTASDIAFISGVFFTPLLIVGIAGNMFTTNFKKYKIDDIDEDSITLQLKDEYI